VNTLAPDGEEVSISKLRVNSFSISIDGYGAGGASLHEWIVATRTFQQLYGVEGGAMGEDDVFVTRGFENIGA
jgi:hypothetical protein